MYKQVMSLFNKIAEQLFKWYTVLSIQVSINTTKAYRVIQWHLFEAIYQLDKIR